MARSRQPSYVFLLFVTFLFCICSFAQSDFLSTLLNSSPECNGTVEDISGTLESECVINKTGGPTSWQVVKYTWRRGAPKAVTDAQCYCGYNLVVLMNNGSMPSSLCDQNSPISCTTLCEPDQGSACSNDTTCDSDENCIMQAINTTDHTRVYVLTYGLACAVLKSYTQDICRVLFESPPTNTPTARPDDVGPIALGVGLALGIILTTVLVVIIGFVWCAFRRMRSRGNKDKVTHAMNKNFTLNGTVLSVGEEDVELNALKNQRYKDMFGNVLTSSKNIHIIDELGEGAFCKVHRGVMVSEEGGYHIENHVAVKHLKATSSAEEVEEFISESAIMLEFDHPNVLQLLGVCFDTEDRLPLIVLPLMSNGDLKSFLIRKRGDDDVNVLPQNLAVHHLLNMCLDIAKGMEYLADMKYIHRDLAARNCMIDDQLLVKVADFGFSRDVYATQYYRLGHKTRLPVKWMPPESLLDNIYNEKSDIWSYGVTCWEVFSLGRGPYPGVDNAEIPEYISNGSRLKQPALCSDDMYSIMMSCWLHKPSERPKFSAIVGYVSQCLESEASPDKIDQQEMHDCNRPYFVLDVKKTPAIGATDSS